MTQSEERSEDTPESGVEKRISQLTRQKHDEARRADGLAAQNAQLTEQLTSLQATVEQLAARPAAQAQPQVDPVDQLLGRQSKPGQTAQAPAQAPVDIAAIVQQSVQAALAPVMQERQQEAQQQALFDAQSRSYQDAAREFLPQALEPGSVEQKTFDAVFQKSQALQLDPDGPAIALAAVAGILGTPGKQAPKTVEARKQAASSPTPLSPLARIADLPSGAPSTKDATNALAREGAEKGLSTDGLAALIGLKTGRAKLSEE